MGALKKIPCPACGEALYYSYCRVMVDGHRTWVVTGLQCGCGYHENKEKGLKILRNKSLF